MTKYKIEGGIDFYAELYKLLDDEESEQKLNQDENLCLITNLPLTDKHVIMDCGHKFNYIPVYKDIINHKQKFNGLEGVSGKLSKNQIRCPYCRKKQTTLLPYYEELELPKINGVNFYDPNANNSYKGDKCCYKFVNDNFDPTQPESETNSKYLDTPCNYGFASKIQIYNHSTPLVPITYGDDNAYCYSHKKMMIKYYKAQEKQKIKDDAKTAKLKEKQEAKLSKELEKQKLKEEKIKEKEANKKNQPDNVVIGLSNVLNDNCCAVIIKSGLNKGKHCGCKIKPGSTMCARHLKTTNNIIIND